MRPRLPEQQRYALIFRDLLHSRLPQIIPIAHRRFLLRLPDMQDLLAYLQDPELVARFQRRCGLYLMEGSNRGSGRITGEKPRGQQEGSWDHQDRNSNYEYKENPAGPVQLVMYIGQAMKDLLKLPRPPSPPVVKLEMRVDAEYGLPSTHAMAATAISFTLLLSAPSRVQFCFQTGLLIAATLSSMVSLSRLYTGMHSVLDVVCGILITAVLILLTYPWWESFDSFQLYSPLSPIVALSLLLLLSYTYPELDHYSTTRGDTTTILGACAGSSVGYWLNAQLGNTFDLQGSLPVPLPALTAQAVARGAARSLVGVVALVGTRQVVRTLSLDALYSWYKLPKTDKEARRRKEIEVPSKFVTYTAVGLVNTIVVNRVFVLLGLL
ncbi:sphingosine-1-phosphate phosphatase 2 isoform X2 [Fundulus heteroclitus]|uniref:sphingosine-1-phosphate phosphatase 2 isoform X2 n=1 Tax=Fundulus heteroclitus TaxID=8078 RepID=UPI00165B9883|nr:sphingosine-1-phosphate phosphatase 2 isoform X2 [Fundulus heteroclitus]